MKNRVIRYATQRIVEILYNLRRPRNLNQLIDNHFSNWSETDHQCRPGISKALEGLAGIDNPVIVETGTSAYGTDSSRLFISFIKLFQGKFYSVDISPAPSRRLRHFKNRNTRFFIQDSVHFLNNFNELTNQMHIDLLYLDSWDVEWDNPVPSATHGLKEFRAVDKLLNLGAYLLIDDTPNDLFWIPHSHHTTAALFKNNFGALPGKGSFVLSDEKFLSQYEVIYHGYNLLARRIK